jgi:membrane associated rhomboid family serine protease
MATFRRWGAPSGGGGFRSNFGSGGYNVFGMYVPKPVAWIIGATLLCTAVGSLLQRNGVPVLTYSVLVAEWVLRGELWRLLTWPLLERDPLNLVFGCFFLITIGSGLVPAWGARKFFLLYFGIAAFAGLMTALIGRFLWAEVGQIPYATMWPVLDAFLIGWAVRNPDAQIRMYFVVPIAGRHLIAFTIAMTVVFALISGFPYYVPHFMAELFALVYMDVFSFRRLYLRGRLAVLQRDYKKRAAHLRMVERDKDDKPPRWMH